MKSFTIATILASAAVVSAQLSFDATTGIYSCPVANGAYCAGTSLQTNIIVRCSNGTGTPGNCNNNLAGVPPIGVKLFAPCYQTSEKAGDAACSYNGVAYPDSGSSFTIPGATVSSTVAAATAAGTAVPATTLAATPVVGTAAAPFPTVVNNATGYTPPTGTWAPTVTPSSFPGAASKVFGPASIALVPVAGLFALFM